MQYNKVKINKDKTFSVKIMPIDSPTYAGRIYSRDVVEKALEDFDIKIFDKVYIEYNLFDDQLPLSLVMDKMVGEGEFNIVKNNLIFTGKLNDNLPTTSKIKKSLLEAIFTATGSVNDGGYVDDLKIYKIVLYNRKKIKE